MKLDSDLVNVGTFPRCRPKVWEWRSDHVKHLPIDRIHIEIIGAGATPARRGHVPTIGAQISRDTLRESRVGLTLR